MWDDHRLLNWIATVLFASALAAFVYGVVVSVIRLPVFAVRVINVTTPVAHTTQEQVARLAREQLRGTFFTVDLEAARAAFRKLPWVREATVRRTWPDRLDVALEEHVALARWRDSGLVNTYGEPFEAATAAELPVFSGPDGTAGEMTAGYLAFRELLARVGRTPVAVQLSDRRAWELTLDDGYVLELGRADLAERLARFTTVYARTVALLPPRAYRVDLRYVNGFALRLPGLRWGAPPA